MEATCTEHTDVPADLTRLEERGRCLVCVPQARRWLSAHGMQRRMRGVVSPCVCECLRGCCLFTHVCLHLRPMPQQADTGRACSCPVYHDWPRAALSPALKLLYHKTHRKIRGRGGNPHRKARTARREGRFSVILTTPNHCAPLPGGWRLLRRRRWP